jgi:membrane-associated phospholipid phosphatase
VDPEVEQVAQFLAAHALLLLGLGMLAAIGAALLIIVAVRVLGRLEPALRLLAAALVTRARDIDILNQLMSRSRLLVPSSYVAVHLVIGLTVTAAVSVFIVIAQEVGGGGEVVAFDLAFARALQRTTTPFAERVFTIISLLGRLEALATVTVVVAIVLLRDGQKLLAGAWVAANAGGALLNLALKNVFERTRPEFADAALAASSWSFPSGHAMGTFVMCGLGSYLLLRDRPSWPVAAFVIATSLAWCLVMGFSRLYLGVHFASDVVAGAIGGAAWVAVCVSALEVVRRRGEKGRRQEVARSR